MKEEIAPSIASPEISLKIKELMAFSGLDTDSKTADLIGQIIESSLKLGDPSYDLGQLKLMTRSFKEMRYAYRVFNKYLVSKRCVSIFGSARTKESNPNYQVAKAFGAAMAAHQWMCMTGAADGIMRASLEDVPSESRFGLSIRLPFENANQTVLAGDPKLINFRYFFTRKLMFLSHSDALAAFPGGVGTQDELFEALTLMQTGRSNIVPIILLEESGGTYWKTWKQYIQDSLIKPGWISPEDLHLFYHAADVEDAVNHILQFYRRYHSSRYVKDTFVIRLKTPLLPEHLEELNRDFQPLLAEGSIYATTAFPEENDNLELPRIVFEHNHCHFGLLRALIDRLNTF